MSHFSAPTISSMWMNTNINGTQMVIQVIDGVYTNDLNGTCNVVILYTLSEYGYQLGDLTTWSYSEHHDSWEELK